VHPPHNRQVEDGRPLPFESFWAHHLIDSYKFSIERSARLFGRSHRPESRENRKPLPGPAWCPQPGRHLPRCLFSQEANSQTHINKDATERPTARTTAGSRSGMDGYELRDHRSQQRLRPIGGYFENFYSSVSRISEEIYSQQAVYLSYTCCASIPWFSYVLLLQHDISAVV